MRKPWRPARPVGDAIALNDYLLPHLATLATFYATHPKATPNTDRAGDTHDQIRHALIATRHTPEGLYGRRKMTHYLRRRGLRVALCTVDRLMGDLGMTGVRRGKTVRTTVQASTADRAGDLLNRDFTAPAPNTRQVADLT